MPGVWDGREGDEAVKRRRRTRLICRWAGVVILVVWGTSFFLGLSVGWNTVPANQFTFTSGWRLSHADLSRGLLHVQLNIRTIRAGETKILTGDSLGRWHPWRTYIFGDQKDPTMWAGKAFTVPATVPLGLSAALIGVSFRRRHPKGHCPKCGYDLTGIADKCPECGRAVKAVKP